jgi:hypothetical protein
MTKTYNYLDDKKKTAANKGLGGKLPCVYIQKIKLFSQFCFSKARALQINLSRLGKLRGNKRTCTMKLIE